MQDHTQATDVERIGSLSRSSFTQKYLALHQPVVLTEPAAQWPAVQKWSLTYLQSVFGGQRVSVEYYPSGERSDAWIHGNMTLGGYIQRVRDDPQARRRYYLAEQRINEISPKLFDDIQLPSLIDRQKSVKTVVFIGYDTFTTAHYHRFSTQAFLTQIVGEKQVTLYRASDLAYLYPYPWYSRRWNFSGIPFTFGHKVDVPQQFPNLTKAHAWQCTIQPGEMLFIPDHWMHTASGFGENLSITFFWKESWVHSHIPGLARDILAEAKRQAMGGLSKVSRRRGMHR